MKNLRRHIFRLMILVLPLQAMSQGTNQTTQTAPLIVIGELIAEDLPVEIWLNDIPMNRPSHQKKIQDTLMFRPALKEGLNKLEVVLFPYSLPSRSRDRYKVERASQAPGKMELTVVVTGEDKKLLTKLYFDEKKTPITQWPTILKTEFNIHHIKPYGFWKAERLDLDPQTLKEIDAEVFKIDQLLKNKKTIDLMPLFKTLIEDLEKDRIPEDPPAKEMILNVFKELAQSKRVPLPKKWEYRLVAESKMIEVIGSDWKELFCSDDDQGKTSEWQLRFGKIKGQWQIL